MEAETNGRHFPDDIFKCIFVNENILISIKISLKFVPKGQSNNITALAQMMAWRHPGDKPLSEHICVTRPQWVKTVITLLALCVCVWGGGGGGGLTVTDGFPSQRASNDVANVWDDVIMFLIASRVFISRPRLPHYQPTTPTYSYLSRGLHPIQFWLLPLA